MTCVEIFVEWYGDCNVQVTIIADSSRRIGFILDVSRWSSGTCASIETVPVARRLLELPCEMKVEGGRRIQRAVYCSAQAQPDRSRFGAACSPDVPGRNRLSSVCPTSIMAEEPQQQLASSCLPLCPSRIDDEDDHSATGLRPEEEHCCSSTLTLPMPGPTPGFGQCRPRDRRRAPDRRKAPMANTKLTDAQRVILAAAAARESGLVLPIPKSLGDNRGTLGIILKSLLTRELITERPIMPDEELWRDTAELGRTTLVISTEGLKLLGIDPIEHVVHQSDGSLLVDETRETATTGRLGASVAEPRLPKAGSKLDVLITALRRPDGATIADLMEATGWQAHSVRGAISGSLKKKLKLEVASDVVGGRGRVYRIAEVASE